MSADWLVVPCAGVERVCDRGHLRGIGVLCLFYNQGLPGLPSGEILAFRQN